MPMEEPSVLDYVKSKLKFWQHGKKIEIPAVELESREIISQQQEVEATVLPVEAAPAEPASQPVTRSPWRSFLALFLALVGQRAFEPASRAVLVGVLLYVVAFGFLVWAYLRGEWLLATPPGVEFRRDSLIYRRLPLIFTAAFTVAAFLTLGGNLFTSLNVTLWILAVLFFIWAMWLREPQRGSWLDRLKGWISRDEWKLTFTRWTLVVLAVIALVVFFRFYRLNAVPAEPFSDHAEKILDVYDITQGQINIFFPRNTGREGFQMYLTLAVAWIFGTGLSFLSLKLGTVLCGLATMPFMYLLGRDVGGKRVGLLAVLFAGIAYWPNVISRAGLRFTLYPFFLAPTLYYLLRGLRTSNRNDFIISGLFLGLGLHGYTPFRIVPFLVVVAVGLYLLHRQSKGNRQQAFIWLAILALAALLVFLPLLRYWLDDPQSFAYRSFTRLGTIEQPLADVWWKILLSNFWNALRMFNWDDGNIWVHSVTHRPALDVVSGALFLIGVVLVFVRYLRQHHWLDLFLLLAIPILQLPSILSLAYPAENPALNRAAGAMVPVFLIIAMAFDGLLTGIRSRMSKRLGLVSMWGVMGILLLGSTYQNYDLVFRQYEEQFRMGAWNSSEMGAVIKQFGQTYGTTDSSWIVPFPYWVDTRLPGVWAGIPNRDFAVEREDLNQTLEVEGPKLFIVKAEVNNPEFNDQATLDALKQLYPQGEVSLFTSKTAGHDFWIFFVPSQ